MIDLAALKEMLIVHEGMRQEIYYDTVGVPTIAVGRNLQDVGVSYDEALYLLDNDVKRVLADLDRSLPWWRTLSDNRQLVLANLCFNLGIVRLLLFKKALAAMQAGEFDLAAAELLNSKWAGQVGSRATTLAGIIATDLV